MLVELRPASPEVPQLFEARRVTWHTRERRAARRHILRKSSSVFRLTYLKQQNIKLTSDRYRTDSLQTRWLSWRHSNKVGSRGCRILPD
jgi:hypothetical protein